MKEKRTSFSGSIGFVLAAAGSAVGLGNIWRFPYLAAKDGGGLYLFIYLFLALTFGFTLLVTEIAIGRTEKPIVAIATCILIGWVLKPKIIIDEVEKGGVKFGRRGLYIVMVKYIAVTLLVILLLKSTGILTVI